MLFFSNCKLSFFNCCKDFKLVGENIGEFRVAKSPKPTIVSQKKINKTVLK